MNNFKRLLTELCNKLLNTKKRHLMLRVNNKKVKNRMKKWFRKLKKRKSKKNLKIILKVQKYKKM